MHIDIAALADADRKDEKGQHNVDTIMQSGPKAGAAGNTNNNNEDKRGPSADDALIAQRLAEAATGEGYGSYGANGANDIRIEDESAGLFSMCCSCKNVAQGQEKVRVRA